MIEHQQNGHSRRGWMAAVVVVGVLVNVGVFTLMGRNPDPMTKVAQAGDKLRLASRLTNLVVESGADKGGAEVGVSRLSSPQEGRGPELLRQSVESATVKSRGCVTCHKDACDPHEQPDLPASFHLGCIDCHGGDSHATSKLEAHVHPRYPDVWSSSANPVRSYTVLNHECPEFIRFVNPGDLRVAHLSCGICHPRETLEVRKSMMTHGCMLWGAALYNNGAVPNKWPRYGESYSMNGTPQRLQTVPAPTPEETATKGILPFLDPLPRFETSQPGNVLRIFERGGRFAPEVGIPETLEVNGRPRQRLSNRGLGTLNRTDPVFIGLQKTRLFDPTLNFMGTNDHNNKLLASRREFQQHGKSGAWMSDLLPHLGGVADDLCIVKSCKTDLFNHAPAKLFMNTGFQTPGRPASRSRQAPTRSCGSRRRPRRGRPPSRGTAASAARAPAPAPSVRMPRRPGDAPA